MLAEKTKEFISYFSDFKSKYFIPHKIGDITGLDINPDFIKLLTGRKTDNQLNIEQFVILPLPKGAIVKNEIKDPPLVASVLKKIILESDLKIKYVALAVNRSAAIIKNFTLDSRLSPDEIESRVWIEANRLFPNLVSDIYLDFTILGPTEQDDSQIEIILVACRRQQMRPYLDIMQLINLTPVIIDVNCYAFERALAKIILPHLNLKTVALLNIDFSLITLIVTHEDKLIYTHELSYDGHSLIKQDSQNENSINNEELLNSISLHLRHSMQFFYSSKPHTNIQKIVLTGDCAVHIPELGNFIQNEIGIETILPGLCKEITINPKVETNKIIHHLPQLILSCGLALSKLN